MRRILTILLAVATSAPGLSGPVAADEPAVNVSHRAEIVEVDNGHLVAALCQAQADPGNPAQVAVDTLVVCDVNGTVRRQVMPGGDAAVVVRVAVVPPITVCVYGEADFVDVVDDVLVAVSGGPACVTYPG